MSAPVRVRLVDGFGRARSVTLGQSLASGGAGSVYSIEGDPLTVVKLYHPSVLATPTRRKELHNRIKSMLDQRPDLPDVEIRGHRYVQLAWPTHIARIDEKFVGFAMPALDINHTKNLEWAINEKQAARHGIRTDLGARVTLARQLASVVAALHARGHYIIDLKPINIQFYPDTLLIAMLDCDGFSIYDHVNRRRYDAPQFTPDYLAPEFQAKLNPNSLPEQQDRFALAVIVFQLLNHGIHPYAGRLTNGKTEPSAIEERIAKGYYPFGLNPHSEIEPPISSGHDMLPQELRELFDRAFAAQPNRRPTAIEWRDCLEQYARPKSGKLVQCAIGHWQFAETECSSCYRSGLKTGQVIKPAGSPNPAKSPTTTSASRSSQPNATQQPIRSGQQYYLAGFFKGHLKAVRSVAFSPDGKTVISGSEDKTLKLWDVATGREIRSFKGHRISVNSVAFSPDGKTVISGSGDETLKLWDVATGREIRSFEGHRGYVLSVAFSPDGKTVISGSLDATLKLWDVATGREIRSFEGHREPVTSVAFSPDGKTVISGSWDATLKLWHVATGREIRSFWGQHLDWVNSVAFSPDGKTVISGSVDNTLMLWKLPRWLILRMRNARR